MRHDMEFDHATEFGEPKADAVTWEKPKQAAARLQIDIRTLYGYLRAGRVTGAEKVGVKLWRIPSNARVVARMIALVALLAFATVARAEDPTTIHNRVLGCVNGYEISAQTSGRAPDSVNVEIKPGCALTWKQIPELVALAAIGGVLGSLFPVFLALWITRKDWRVREAPLVYRQGVFVGLRPKRPNAFWTLLKWSLALTGLFHLKGWFGL